VNPRDFKMVEGMRATFNATISVLDFMKIYRLVQKLLVGDSVVIS
jgi:hypothetical protein